MKVPYKISVLLYCFDEEDRILLLHRNREPNKGLWSPCGGKLKTEIGESPYGCAVRELREETGMSVDFKDLHLAGIVSEESYEGSTHWLMFLFEVKKKFSALPSPHSEGIFCFFEKKDMYRADSSRTRIAFFRGLFVFLQSLAVGLLLFSFWLPYDISYNFYSYVLGVSVGISVVYACLRPRLSWEWSQSRPFLPMVLLYLLMWLSVLYSMDKVEAVRRCWYCLSLLLYPVIFVGMGRDFFSVKRCRLWAVVFVASCFVEILCRTGLSVYCFCTVPELEPYRQVGFVAALNEFLGFQNIYLS